MRPTRTDGGRWLKLVVMAFALLPVAMPETAFAQRTVEPTGVSITMPEAAVLGERVTLQARLVGGSGEPLPKTLVMFTSPSSFLNVKGDVVVARAMTNNEGLAVASFEVRSTGQFTVQAEFPGNERYGPASASAVIVVDEAPRQLYTQHSGVRIPGLSAPPAIGPLVVMEETSASGLVYSVYALWPNMSGWPIAAALLVIWSLYASVVVLMFRVAALGSEARPATQFGRVHQSSVTSGGAQRGPDPRSQEPGQRGGGQ